LLDKPNAGKDVPTGIQAPRFDHHKMFTKVKSKEEYWIGFNEYKTDRRLNISYTNKFEGFWSVAKHHYGLNDYGIRSPVAKNTFRHCNFICLACEKCGVINGEHHMKAMEAAAILLEQSTSLTPSNYARAHSTKLKLRGKHATKK
jgi:hypothetical protein